MEKNDYREMIMEMINEIDELNVLQYVYIIIFDIMEEKENKY